MIILFVNAHKDPIQGQSRFNNYYKNIRNLLLETVYYGNQIQEIIRKPNQLQDFLYDQQTYRMDQKAKNKFLNVQYVFIDGSISSPPWVSKMKSVLLLIKLCIRKNKKFHLNGYAHLALYFYVCTQFQKDFVISNKKTTSKQLKFDYQYDDQTGNLEREGKYCVHSGIKSIRNKNSFSYKSSSALNQGVILPTKLHFLAFDSKTGNKILEGIKFPFSFFNKGRLFCTSKLVSQANVQVLVETEDHIPLAYAYQQGISTHGISPQFLQIISNWLYLKVGFRNNIKKTISWFQQVTIQNQLTYKQSITNSKSISRITSQPFKFQSRPNTSLSKPNSSKCSEILINRYSIPYNTKVNETNVGSQEGKEKLIYKNRKDCKSQMKKNEIVKYVSQMPKRPPTSHQFRDVKKQKWLSKDTFVLF